MKLLLITILTVGSAAESCQSRHDVLPATTNNPPQQEPRSERVDVSDRSRKCDEALPSRSMVDRRPNDPVDTLPHFYSKRLERLFANAKAASRRPIRFSWFRASVGNTSATETSKQEQVVLLRSGMDQALEENAIAHELFHVILQHQGFAALVHVPGETKADELLKEIGFEITSCVDDALIDRKMASLGFNPRILNHDTSDTLKQNPATAPTDPLVRDGNALLIVCYANRIKFRLDQIEQTWEGISPDVVRRSHMLARQIGDIKCGDARSCLDRKKHIRDVLGYAVQFCNPSSGNYE